jgi:hypothetical protein
MKAPARPGGTREPVLAEQGPDAGDIAGARVDERAPDPEARRHSASALPHIQTGAAAAAAIIALMDRSATAIPPTDLVDAYVDAGGTSTVAVLEALWSAFGQDSIGVMADGVRVLARIWQGAWAVGSGNAIASGSLGAITPNKLIACYTECTFVESLDLDHIGATHTLGPGSPRLRPRPDDVRPQPRMPNRRLRPPLEPQAQQTIVDPHDPTSRGSRSRSACVSCGRPSP